jgi:hypothetical protein
MIPVSPSWRRAHHLVAAAHDAEKRAAQAAALQDCDGAADWLWMAAGELRRAADALDAARGRIEEWDKLGCPEDPAK